MGKSEWKLIGGGGGAWQDELIEKEGKVEGLPSGAPISPVRLGRQETGPHQAELPASLTGPLAEGPNLDTFKGCGHHCR